MDVKYCMYLGRKGLFRFMYFIYFVSVAIAQQSAITRTTYRDHGRGSTVVQVIGKLEITVIVSCENELHCN